jgi:hypothetical protein
MKPAKLDLPTIWRGCDWGPVTLKWKDKDGIGVNLAGWQCRAQSLNIFLGAAITESAHGVTTLSLSRGETALFKLGVESWDWIWEHVDHHGIVDYRFPPFLAGKVQIKDPVTKAGIDPLIPNLPSDDEPPELVEAPPIFSLPS